MLTVFTLTEGEISNRDAETERLIARMSRGEIAAMGELYELIGTDVYAFALSKTANKEWAEDVTHDTFVRIWKSAGLYHPLGKPLAWVFTIEINLIRKMFNKSKSFVPLEEAIEVEGDGQRFDDALITNEFLRQMLEALSEEERTVVTLHIVSGFKHREIARLLNKPLSTVLSKYNRAIKKLQIKVMEKEGQ